MPKGMSGAEARLLRQLRDKAAYEQKGICYYCEEPMVSAQLDPQSPKRITAEHLTPRHAGGQTVHGNIVAACAKCNNERRYPERQSFGGGVVATAGDPAGPSPFAPLQALLEEK